jgi:mannose-6-phosphate isomerase-like protein (cupin superfamily)
MISALDRMRSNMTAVIDLPAELARLTMLRDRTPTTPPSAREGTLVRLAPYRDGAIFVAKFAGKSDWERHPHGAEIVQIIEGTAILHLADAAGRQTLSLSAGMMAIVPENTWHQFESWDGVCLMTATPQPSDHLRGDTDDPVAASSAHGPTSMA